MSERQGGEPRTVTEATAVGPVEVRVRLAAPTDGRSAALLPAGLAPDLLAKVGLTLCQGLRASEARGC
jgi:hypothetical protein